ncbi:MAG: hypothetical protein U0573_15015 [Phycisphaerales bacterium]|nr:hypothetical protein [Planctomycetota bacterium]
MRGVHRFIPLRLLLGLLLLTLALLPGRDGFAADPAATPPSPDPRDASRATAVSAARQAKNPFILTVQGPIDSITAHAMKRRLDDAVAGGADAIILDLDTPGGELGAVLEISNLLKNSPVRNTVAWIHPQAYSGGAIIALACREIVVAGSAGFGDAKVIRAVDPYSFSTQIRGLNDDERQKFLPPLLADVVDSARRHNRNVGAYQWDELLVQAIVATDAELWWVEDSRTGTRFAIDRAEFEALFPDQPILQPMVATASVGSNEKNRRAGAHPVQPAPASASRHTAPQGDSEESSFSPASPTIGRLGGKLNEALSLAGASPSMRPRIDTSDPDRYRLLAKICNGDGAIVLRAGEMAYFGFAANSAASAGQTPDVEAIDNDAQLATFLAAPGVTRLDESWSEEFARFMSRSWVRGLLVTIFLICLFIEMFSPGITIPGTIGFFCLVGLFLPSLVVGMAMWWQLAAIVLGILLLAAEILVLPGFGIPGILGILCLVVGLIGVFIPGSSGIGASAAEFRSGLATGVTTLILAAATTWITLFFVYRNIANIPALRRLVLQNPDFESGGEVSMLAAMSQDEVRVGDEGVAATPLRPSGKMDLNGKLHDVVAEFGFIDQGSRVRVVSVTPFRIGVESVREA